MRFLSPGTYRLDGYFEGATGDDDVASSVEFTILRAPRFDTPAVASDDLTFTVTNAWPIHLHVPLCGY